MKRRALLIMNPGKIGKNFVPSVPNVIERYKNFLMSPAGGAWIDEEEILVLDRLGPMGVNLSGDLAMKLNELNKTDVEYSLIVFVGHGAAASGKDSIQTEDGKIYSLDDFTMNTHHIPNFKRTIIIDACRTYAPITPQHIMLEEKAFSGLDTLDADCCREYYNDIIAHTPEHVSVIQSTQYGMVANGTPLETAFSDALIGHLSKMANILSMASDSTQKDHISITMHDVLNTVCAAMSAYKQVPQFTTIPQDIDKFFPILAIHRPLTKSIDCPESEITILED